MDPSLVIERLESLWFSTNILLPRNEIPISISANLTEEKPKDLIIEEKVEEGEFSTPVSPVQNCQQSDSPRSETTPSLLRCPRCGEFPAEIHTHLATPADEEEIVMPKSPEKEEKRRQMRSRRRRRRRSRRRFDKMRKIFQEFDEVLERKNVYDPWTSEEEFEGIGIASSHQLRMPPLSDAMAMKQHLKSWAYAVACTVR